MAGRPALAPPAAAGPARPGPAAAAEQALFTSIPSPLGRGYRIVAASPGLTADERREIVRCAPAHGGLCDPHPDATGLASFTLPSGRRCLFLARHDGIEQTARGGYRVWTRVLVLAPADYLRFGADPLAVAAAVPPPDPRPLRSPPPTLPPLPLAATAPPGSRPAHSTAPPPADVPRILRILAAALEQRPLLVTGAPQPAAVLRWTLDALPAAQRALLSVSCGLRCSPTRRFALILGEAQPGEIEALLLAAPRDVVPWSASPPRPGGPFAAWLRLAALSWEQGRADALRRLTDRLVQATPAAALARIAALALDLARVPEADAGLLDALGRQHAAERPDNEVHADLLDAFGKAVAARRAALAPADAERSASADGA